VIVDLSDYYSQLFGPLETEFGPLDPETITAVIGFSAGGPVSLSFRREPKLFVTCELSLYPEQVQVAEGINYELFCVDQFSEDESRKLFTALGALAMDSELGTGHTIDVTGVIDDQKRVVRMETLFAYQLPRRRVRCIQNCAALRRVVRRLTWAWS
jgi:hypothetical protein